MSGSAVKPLSLGAYERIKRETPDLFPEVQKMIEEGKYVLVGGSVCNQAKA